MYCNEWYLWEEQIYSLCNILQLSYSLLSLILLLLRYWGPHCHGWGLAGRLFLWGCLLSCFSSLSKGLGKSTILISLGLSCSLSIIVGIRKMWPLSMGRSGSIRSTKKEMTARSGITIVILANLLSCAWCRQSPEIWLNSIAQLLEHTWLTHWNWFGHSHYSTNPN